MKRNLPNVSFANITASGEVSVSGKFIASNNIELDDSARIYSKFTNRGRIDLFSSSANEAAQVQLQGGDTKLTVRKLGV